MNVQSASSQVFLSLGKTQLWLPAATRASALAKCIELTMLYSPGAHP